MSFDNVGKVWSVAEFKAYLDALQPLRWPTAICLHHTASPSLSQRPSGLTKQHIRNIVHGYKNDLGWDRGPHLFIDDTAKCIMGMTPLHETGVHAKSFNASAIGIEVLGNYDSESPTEDRGLRAWINAAAATKLLLEWLKLPVVGHEKMKPGDTVIFHRDDERTSKTCPGKKVSKPWFLDLINEL